MFRFIVGRLLGAVVVLFFVSVVTFLIFQIAPLLSHTSPVYFYTGKVPFAAGSPALKALIHQYGFDLPVPVQYWQYVSGIFTGRTISDGTTVIHCTFPCLGYSFRQNELVSSLLTEAAPVSISLCVGAAVLWLVGGVLVGTVSALRPGSIVDRAGMGLSLGAVSLPIFFTGPLLLLVFEYQLGWINENYVPITQDPLGWLGSMILPWFALAFLFAALYARLTRSNMLETLGEDYMRTARAKGLDRRTVIVKHGLRAALTPIVTIFGIDFGTLIGSTVITETVFNLRGLGYLSITAISQQDLPIILGVTLVAAVALVVANVLVDITYAFIDPRVAL
ncbi:MAG: ABC transporter permease [Acidobacteria bacterium]|nr:ABC transporter permease [Acidobacteriota bacterium]